MTEKHIMPKNPASQRKKVRKINIMRSLGVILQNMAFSLNQTIGGALFDVFPEEKKRVDNYLNYCPLI